jgi:ATP phosphoribosyltransferase
MSAQADLRIAVAKGRVLAEALPLLARCDIVAAEDPLSSRKLIIPTTRAGLSLVIIRAADVPTYVGYGAADLGITGKDVLLEYAGEDLYEPLDLGIGRCRLMVAGRPGANNDLGRLRVATKYPSVTRRHFARKGMQTEVIKLYGSMELAPILGLADKIVDLVDTGNTLKANGLVAEETICDISSRLIVNKASMKIRHPEVQGLILTLGRVVTGDTRSVEDAR